MTRIALLCTSLTILLIAPPARAGSLGLSPAVVTLRGEAGQSTRQQLTIQNGSAHELAFDLVAMDVVVRDGKRTFVAAGELRGSIAATAVFSEKSVVVRPSASRTVEVTVTLPPATRHRAIVALFRGTTRLGGRAARATVTLGTLLTFTVSDRISVAASDLTVEPPSDSENAAFELACANDGDEPVVPRGMAVVLDGAGRLVGKVALTQKRLLPGERGALRAEYPGELRPGAYRVVVTLEVEGRSLVRQAELRVR
jgi:hypothetical protein